MPRRLAACLRLPFEVFRARWMTSRSTASTWDLRSSEPLADPLGPDPFPFESAKSLESWSAGSKHRGPLQRVPELANVAGPAMVSQSGEGSRGNAHRMAQPLGHLPGEVSEQLGDVLGAFPQRRNVQPNHVQPVIQVGAEFAPFHRFLHRTAGGGEHPHIDLP